MLNSPPVIDVQRSRDHTTSNSDPAGRVQTPARTNAEASRRLDRGGRGLLLRPDRGPKRERRARDSLGDGAAATIKLRPTAGLWGRGVTLGRGRVRGQL